MDIALVRVQANGRTTRVPLKDGAFVIGRQTDCQLRVPTVDVSRHHCRITVDDGAVSVSDAGSRNGTYVNGEKVDNADLAPGDLLCVGPVVFLIQIDGDPADFDAAAKFREGQPGGDAEPAAASRSPSEDVTQDSGFAPQGLMDSADDSSIIEFDFDLDDDEDDQPPL